MIFDLQLLYLVALWGVALWCNGSRNFRFLTFMSVITAAWIAVGWIAPDLTRLVRASLALIWLAAVLAPERLRLGSLSATELRFDAWLRGLDRTAREAAAGRGVARAALPDMIIEFEAVATPASAWDEVKARMLADLRRDGNISQATYVAWRNVRYRRVIGWR